MVCSVCMIVTSVAQVLCDAFFSFFVFADSEYGHRTEVEEISNREIVVGAAVLLSMAHVLISLSLFTKSSIFVCTMHA